MQDTVVEGLLEFFCTRCGWWGPSPDRMIYEPRDPDDFGERQVRRRRTDDPEDTEE
jgi:hypothetical protein